MIKLYALELTKPGARVSRFALYRVKNGALEVVWPNPKSKEENDNQDRNLLPCQVAYPRPKSGPDKFPAYHFAVGNIGYNKLAHLREELKDSFGGEIQIERINGWAPSHS